MKNDAASIYPLTLLYDGACPVCKLEMRNLASRDRKGELRFVDVSVPGFDAARYGLALPDLLKEIHAVQANGAVVRGLEVLRLTYSAVGLGWLARPTGWPLLKPAFDRLYVLFARNRYRVPAGFASVLFRLAARNAVRRTHACSDGKCKL
ncbi:Predicted thiol-disulfide oxidoreductase YuxK, DCC family [Noviherbaspirillum humi]|uniref:Predicted thiol-disulfide oxidoreductase YuxK, DCC family n=2 Tax=Noviherbaspirillum humi TaxID=1688639 RepID=A0A239FF35_9BURK|nr:Predicted thiol-disulfide oxidoreductase YuxK, DCC family [Noviherbaspirillum humi]